MKANVPPPRKTAKQTRFEKRWAAVLAGVLVLAVLSALLLTVPGFSAGAQRLFGITQATVPAPGGSNVPVAVHFINVGQGDAVLLEDNGAFALLDAGTPDAAADLVAYLQAAGVQHLEYLVMTHPHADHIGGMKAVVQNFTVGLALLPNFDLAPLPTTSTFEQVLEALLERQVPSQTAAIGQSFPLGAGTLSVLHAGLESDAEYNLLSLGLLFESSGLRFLNTGDGEKQNERAMLDAEADITATLFMAAHHGSKTSNTKAFLQAVSPQLVVISCGAANSYGHPHRSALEAFAAVGALVLRTDELGSVVVKPSGDGALVYATAKEAA